MSPKNLEFVKLNTLQWRQDLFTVDNNFELSHTLRRCYSFDKSGCEPWMKHCLLSPRGIFIQRSARVKGFLLCHACQADVRRATIPTKAIVNGFFFGTPPPVLTELSDGEMAVLTPVTAFGYCFAFNGGKAMKLQGMLGYYRVAKRKIARVTIVAHTLANHLNRNVVFLLTSNMTKRQTEWAMHKMKIWPQKMMLAIEWLVNNNHFWRGLDIWHMQQDIANCVPVRVDMTTEIESNDSSAAEDQDSFFFFSDGTMTDVFGGVSLICDFNKVVHQVRSQGFDGQVVSKMSGEFAQDFMGDNLAESCLLQFPFGRGGMNETRINGEENIDSGFNLMDFVEHITDISQPQFQTPLFVLKLFNSRLRTKILRKSNLQINREQSVINIRKKVSSTNFALAMNAHAKGMQDGSVESNALIRSINSISRSLPHTNASVKRAKQYMESLQHQFGLGGIFLTVTPNDENSFFVTSHSQIDKNAH